MDVESALRSESRLQALASVQLIDTPVEASFDRLTQLASKVLRAPVSLVSLVEPHRQFIKSHVGLLEPLASLREVPITHSFCKYVVASGEPLVIDDARDHPLVCLNPAIRDYDVVAYLGIPLTSDDGWHLGSFCVIDHEPRQWTPEDVEIMQTLAASVTTQIQLRLVAEAKERALAMLEQRNEELNAFAHSVSHNLKNPISAIIGWASLSMRYADKATVPDLLETLSGVEDTARQANDIINALLLLAGVGSSNFETVRLDMFSLVEDALQRLDMDIRRAGATVHLPDEFPDCLGYGDWVREVWVNYISNAIKYGGRPPQIRLGADLLDDNRVRYWIQDNGPGLPEDQQGGLFVPFSRLPQTAKIEGHGLGLSIVQRIIDKLGGEVGLQSMPGQGSRFSFTLPQPRP